MSASRCRGSIRPSTADLRPTLSSRVRQLSELIDRTRQPRTMLPLVTASHDTDRTANHAPTRRKASATGQRSADRWRPPPLRPDIVFRDRSIGSATTRSSSQIVLVTLSRCCGVSGAPLCHRPISRTIGFPSTLWLTPIHKWPLRIPSRHYPWQGRYRRENVLSWRTRKTYVHEIEFKDCVWHQKEKMSITDRRPIPLQQCRQGRPGNRPGGPEMEIRVTPGNPGLTVWSIDARLMIGCAGAGAT